MDKTVKEQYIKRAEARIDGKLRAICASTGLRADSEGVVFTRGQLENLEETIFEVLFRDNQEAFKLLPLRPRFEPGWQSYSYRMETAVGTAKLMSHEGEDRPLIDTYLDKSTVDIVEFGASYNYYVGTTEAAAIMDYDHVAAKARAAAEAIVRAHNTYLLTGDTASGATGFLNSASVTDATLVDGDWTSFTAANAFDDVAAVINAVSNQSLGRHNVTDVALSLYLYNKIASTRIDTTSGQSILDALKGAFPGVTFHRVAACTDAGDSSKDLVVAYEKNADRVEAVVPVLFDEAAPDKEGFSYKVACRGRSAGTVIRYPLSMAYGNITVP
jgi:hypothetical protein